MENRKRIIKAAEEKFGKYGFRRVTIGEVCEAAGISRMTFYRSFSDKKELVLAVLEETFQRESSKMERILNSDEKVAIRIQRLLDRKFSHTLSIDPEILNDITRPENRIIQKRLHELNYSKTELFVSVLKKCQEGGEIPADVNLALVPYIVEAMVGIASKIGEYEEDPLPMLNDLVDYFIRSLGLRPSRMPEN